MRVLTSIFVLLAFTAAGWFAWSRFAPAERMGQMPGQIAHPTVVQQPVSATTRTFDPANPPGDMPPLPAGEDAQCDSNFVSNASVGGERRRIDATHAALTVTHVNVQLQLNITIWLPQGAGQRVIEHENGHREISEYYYQTANQIAKRIAETYIGKQVDISGPDFDAAAHQALQQMASEITQEYDRELNTEPTQLLYDSITDHSRNGVDAEEAVAHALKNAAVEAQ